MSTWGDALSVKSSVRATISKLLSEISKNVPLEQITIIRAVVVGVFGTETNCEPSLGTLLASVTGYVAPPSVERRMSTFEQETGAISVFATSHVTVSFVSDVQTIPVADG